MNKYKFKVNNSKQKEFILEINAYNFYEARDKAQKICYKAGYCFLGRV